MEIDIKKTMERVPKIDLKYPDGQVKPLFLYGPLAAQFRRTAARATGMDKIPTAKIVEIARMEVSEEEKGKRMEALGIHDPDEQIIAQAVDDLLRRDHADLCGKLPLSIYQDLFLEVNRLIAEDLREEGDGESKKSTNSSPSCAAS